MDAFNPVPAGKGSSIAFETFGCRYVYPPKLYRRWAEALVLEGLTPEALGVGGRSSGGRWFKSSGGRWFKCNLPETSKQKYPILFLSRVRTRKFVFCEDSRLQKRSNFWNTPSLESFYRSSFDSMNLSLITNSESQPTDPPI